MRTTTITTDSGTRAEFTTVNMTGRIVRITEAEEIMEAGLRQEGTVKNIGIQEEVLAPKINHAQKEANTVEVIPATPTARTKRGI